MYKFITGEQFGAGLKQVATAIDTKINNLSQNGRVDGDVTNNYIINEMSNPLTMNPLEYGSFMINEHFTNVATNVYVPFDRTVSGNLVSNDKGVKLKGGNTYSIDLGSFTNGSGFIVVKGVLSDYIDNTEEELFTLYTESNISISENCNMPTTSIVVDVKKDSFFRFKIFEVKGSVTYVNKHFTYLTIKECRNNPVAQYGGFETEILFEGKASEIGEYELTDNINNYNLALIYSELNENSSILNDVMPAMTSNTTPAPYVISASESASTAYKAFDDSENNMDGYLWYGSTSSFPKWIKVDMGNVTQISHFSITNGNSSSNYHSYPPKKIVLEGSNDDSAYTPIGTYSINQLGSDEKHLIALSSAVSYRYYKFNITEGWGSAIIISELNLMNSSSSKSKISSNIVVPNSNDLFCLDSNNGNIIICFESNILQIEQLNTKCITKIIGIKGQLPSLLVGGEF